MKVKTLKKIRFWLKYRSSYEKITKLFELVRTGLNYYRKSPIASLTKLSSNKGHIIINITGKFHSFLRCSSCFMDKL